MDVEENPAMADSHAHTLPEPKTPMWLPALGATLFLMAGVWWAYTSSNQHETEHEQAKPAASAHP
jgi:hypothetical protein